ncbi:MAG TPA: hypothetical protein VMI47_13820 [Pseudolabrys sp.]|nr:hypothetical protein [Pseudolabrys sp.]
MSDTSSAREQGESDIFSFDLSDEAIERAADGKALAANPTVPSAIICIPFGV